VTDDNLGVKGSTQTISLTGTGTGTPAASLSATSLTFPAQAVLTTSTEKTVTLTNGGTSALSITSIVATGDWAESNTCGTSVPVKGKCKIQVTFTPTATGTLSGAITITDNASTSPQAVSLSGTGVAQVKLSTTSLTFASRTVGTTSAAKEVTFTNELPAALTMGTITFEGSDPGDFSQTNTCGASLAAKAKCTLSVTFTPAATGTRTATMGIGDSANNSPQTVSLTGTGK
jgi:hypothetical protein